MQFKERLFHSVLFEIGAVAIASLAVVLASSQNAQAAISASIFLAVVAMVWNIIFNWGFDKVFTGKREERGFKLRLFHTIAFECGLLIATVPMIAYLLNLSLWQAFWADVGLTLLITVYALLFNWAYDHLRVRFVANPV